jgi:hypothetical protein
MARPTRATLEKRGRERAKQEKRKAKLERRLMKKQERQNTPRPVGAEDPDLAGIVPGPQPPPEW